MNRRANFGAVSLDDGNIVYRDEELQWCLPISSICLVGEYTNQSGPVADDYFIVLLSRTRESWYEISHDAAGLDALMNVLRDTLGGALDTKLANSTDFRSRVMWPAALVDKPLFDFVPSNSIWGRIGLRIDQRLNADVVAWVGGNGI
jgi:hypothetical protein